MSNHNHNRASWAGILLMLTLAGCSSTPKEEVAVTEPVDDAINTIEEDIDESAGIEDSSTYSADVGTSASSVSGMDASENALLDTTVFYFDFDEFIIKPEAYPALKAHAKYLSSNGNVKVRVEGHADERGTREYNMALGERRGNSVSKFLRLNGVSGSQLEVISFGEEKPMNYGHNEASWTQNRRVEIKYVR